MKSDPVIYSVSEKIATITLNHAEKRNALSPEMIQAIKENLNSAELDPNVRVVILNANGPAFSAGADLAYLQSLQKNTYEENLEDSRKLMDMLYRIHTLEKPVIAQVEGPAIAGGCGLTTVCDFVFAIPDAVFGYSEVRIGFVPALVMTFLIRKTGDTVARELLLTGNRIDAEKAKQSGLINFISQKGKIEEDVRGFSKKIIENCSPESLRITKQMMAKIQHLSLDDALNYAAEMNASARETEDCKKGISAFLNKEKIIW